VVIDQQVGVITPIWIYSKLIQFQQQQIDNGPTTEIMCKRVYASSEDVTYYMVTITLKSRYKVPAASAPVTDWQGRSEITGTSVHTLDYCNALLV